MSRRYSSSRVPAQKLADRIETKCQAKNRLGDLNGQIRVQESLIRSANITILKYKKEIRLIEEKFELLPKTRRGMNKNKPADSSKVDVDPVEGKQTEEYHSESMEQEEADISTQ